MMNVGDLEQTNFFKFLSSNKRIVSLNFVPGNLKSKLIEDFNGSFNNLREVNIYGGAFKNLTMKWLIAFI